MNEIIDRLKALLFKLNKTNFGDLEVLIDSKNQLNLYIQKYFESKKVYLDILKEINAKPGGEVSYKNSITELKSLTQTLIQDLELSNKNIDLLTEQERSKIISEARKEVEIERDKIQNDAREIRSLRELLSKEREELLSEENKFNEFKTKLELADKELDFQFEAINNKKAAVIWASIAATFVIILLIILFKTLDGNNSLSDIANDIKQKMVGPDKIIDSLISTTIYFTYSKYLFTKILLYSLIIYAITFCTKNYTAQMHNHTINVHKSNAFKSTLSLLNTAKSADGNDKLLIQATQAIFSHQNTGYNEKESEPTSPNIVTNVIDAAAKKI